MKVLNLDKVGRAVSVTDEDRNPTSLTTSYSSKLVKIVDQLQKLNEDELKQLNNITCKCIANKQYFQKKYSEAVSNY